MTAYGLSERFPPPPDCHRVGSLDPGAYYISPYIVKHKENKVPFLSKCPRDVKSSAMYTHAIYNAEKYHHIPGVVAFKSKSPRFEYDTAKWPDYRSPEPPPPEPCQCERECVCPAEEPPPYPLQICQATVPRTLYKGHVPLSRCNPADFVFTPMQTRCPKGSPRFYDARYIPATDFYKGWKWSQRTSRRSTKGSASTPGPADYTIEAEPSPWQRCMQEYRIYKQRTARQLRFIEIVQLRNILTGGPGPSDYIPRYPKCDITEWGPKAVRFPVPKYVVSPGPADYTLQGMAVKGARNVTPFGVTAERFKYKTSTGPGPAEYDPRIKRVERDKRCETTAPFGFSGVRFKREQYEESDEEEDECSVKEEEQCPKPMWFFKSKVNRFKPLMKRLNWPSPAEYVLPKTSCTRRRGGGQVASPFQSSEARFRPWRNYIEIFGSVETPGTAYYDTEYRPSCGSDGHHLAQAPRFPRPKLSDVPAPNAYNIPSATENIKRTFNSRLAKNKKDLFKWSSPMLVEPRSIQSREMALWKKSVQTLDIPPGPVPPDPNNNQDLTKIKNESKKNKEEKIKRTRKPGDKLLLKYFLYDHTFRRY